jgi:dihydroorotate dehydrogenase
MGVVSNSNGSPSARPEADLLDRLLVNLDRLLVNLARHGLQEDADLRAEIMKLLTRGGDAAMQDEIRRHELAMAIRRFCYVRDLPDVLSLSGAPVVYNFRRSFDDNVRGPWDRLPDWDGVTRGRRWSLLGFDIGYPIGIPASALTVNADYIEYYARYGFNVMTYKTVRSMQWEAHPEPNWVYLSDLDTPLPLSDEPPTGPVRGDRDTFIVDTRSFSTANSFGVPSEAPTEWKQDVATALARLGDGKILIVSVIGSSEREELQEPEKLADDFAAVAVEAEQIGAPAIELNLSCPNTIEPGSGTIKALVCLDADLTALIVARVADSLKPETKLVAKLSWMRHDLLERVLDRIVDRVDCVSGINTLPMKVVDAAGRPTFGERQVAGVSGIAIRNYGLDFVRALAEIKERRGWAFEVLAMGGVMGVDDVHAYLDAGADAVQTATAAQLDPTLALALTEPANASQTTTVWSEVLTATARQILSALAENPDADVPRLASFALLSPSTVRAGVSELKRRGFIRETSRRGDANVGYRIEREALKQLVG